MTAEEKQEIVSEVLSAIRTNSAQINDLTEVQEVPSGGYIEISGGRRISAQVFLSLIQAAIVDESVNPLITRLNGVEAETENLTRDKLDKANVVEGQGNSSELVLSQKFLTLMFNSLGIQIGNIKVVKGTNNASVYEIKYTNSQGNTSTISIDSATGNRAGLLSAADKTALEVLKVKKLESVELDYSASSVELAMDKADGSGWVIEFPIAGSTPSGQESPVAGVMSAGQAEDLDACVLQVFPLSVVVSVTNAGNYERGTSVTPSVYLGITRRGVGVAQETTLTTPMRVVSETANNLRLEYDPITENTSFNIAVHHKGSTVNVAQQQYRFMNYVYGDVLTIVPNDIADAIYNARTLQELSTRTTYSGTLQANKLFLFAVPGNVTLLCKHSETGADISGCTTGICLVPRRQDNETRDTYSYIIVPASDVAWNFKITNN